TRALSGVVVRHDARGRAIRWDQLPIGGARGCSGLPPPPIDSGPVLATTARLARITLMSCDQGEPLPAAAWNGYPHACWNCVTTEPAGLYSVSTENTLRAVLSAM